MTHAEVFAAARAKLTALENNPLAINEADNLRMLKKSVGEILTELEAAIQPTPCPYLRGDVTQWCVLAESGEVDYVKQPDDKEYAE